MKHITPQAQNHIFKEKRGRNPVPFQEGPQGGTGFITLCELKILEKRRKNNMDSDSDSDDPTSLSFIDDADTNDKCTETNDDTLTTDGKEIYDDEDELVEEDDLDVDETKETEDETKETEDDVKDKNKSEEFGLRSDIVKNLRKNGKKQKKLSFTMDYEVIDDEW